MITLSLCFSHYCQFGPSIFGWCWWPIEATHLRKDNLNRLNPLQSRALSNQRLRIAFGIDNAFTSHEVNRVKTFTAQAKSLINLSPSAWSLLSDTTHRNMRRSIIDRTGDCNGETRIQVVDLVHTLTLRMVLHVLFSMEEEAFNLPDRCFIELASAINSTWIMSKTERTPPRFENNSRLQNAILAIFPPTQDLSPQNNPLNMILPGFDTMWRIVLRMFIEIGFSTGVPHSEWRTQLAAFARTPSKAAFVQRPGLDAVSVEHLVNEALRLYPPTKRLYRAFQYYESSAVEVKATDIEEAHTAEHIWGPSVMSFDPRRWHTLENTQKQSFSPFGKKPVVCPAQSAFGPMVIGLIVGVLFMELGDDWILGSTEDRHGNLHPGIKLSNERDSYQYLYLARVDDRLAS
ncbi:Cytochrome P450 [Penicillium frequentans]|uniref:Cytochrome P450 n=1 Tax=Penicillium frequentans TaxID=3151616 RepID=A0AAD6D7D1_9EURO|nr:Cytochrome P450 [Penicillium glabrum]